MPDPQPDAPAVSPTGKALVPPAAVPYLVAAWAAMVAIVHSLPAGKLQTYGQLALTVLGPLLGVLSPGIRKSAS